jgi:pyridoxine 4-dehydrogenase
LSETDFRILLVAPLGRGFLTGKIKSIADIPEGDFRRMLPRFSPENFDANLKLVLEIENLAEKKKCTPAQIAINWIRALSKKPGMPTIIPIPGAAAPERVRENAKIIDLTDEDLQEIDAILASFTIVGDRYHKHGMEFLDTDS